MTHAVLNVADLDGTNGFVIRGVDSFFGFDNSGYSVSSAGDINGDGIDDLIIGAPNAYTYYSYFGGSEGESYVVFGSSDGFDAVFELSSLDGSNGFVIRGVDGFGDLGRSVSSAGDINGDGIDDLVIGAPGAGTSYYGYYGFYYGNDSEGESYVIFGSTDEFNSVINVFELDGSNGFVIQGVDSFDNSGWSVSSAGDVNGDGIDDLIIGAPNADTSSYGYYGYYGPYYNSNVGESYVVFGSSDGFDGVFELSSLDGSNGFVIPGVDSFFGFDNSGYSVSSAGDINGDGIDDLIIGAPNAYTYYSYFGGSEGESYVVFGSSDGFDGVFELSSLDGSNGFVIRGVDGFGDLGRSVSSAGDINGDGIDDLVIGAPGAGTSYYGYYGFYYGNDSEGESYVIFGSTDEFNSVVNVFELDGSNGFVIQGVDSFDRSGYSVSNAGDFNGDGIDDLIIGAPYADTSYYGYYGYYYNSNVGESYVVFGSSDGFGGILDLANLDDTNGFIIEGVDSFGNSGWSVSSAGDINGDGADDLIVGAPNAGTSYYGSNTGESYVIFGFISQEIKGTSGNDILDGGTGNDTISGLNGNDIIDGGAGQDSISGGNGNDILSGGSGNDEINGDGGADTILGEEGNDTIFGGAGKDNIIAGSGNDEINGDGGADIILGEEGNDTIFGGAGKDNIIAGSGNDEINGDGGADTILGEEGNDTIFGGAGSDILTGGTGDDNLSGGNGKDTITGGGGNDFLDGGSGNDRLVGVDFSTYGTGEVDTLTGGSRRDTFVLGDAENVFYDDGIASTTGESDFALITDFNSRQDKIELSGSAEFYTLDLFPSGTGTTNAAIIYDPGASARGELIAIVEDVSANLDINNSAFEFLG